LGFNAQQYEPTMGMEAWPEGWVPVIIASADAKTTSSGGGMLGLVLQAVDGPLRGKQQFLGLNLWHSNPNTVEIANKTLSAITYVTLGANKGTLAFNDTSELCNIPFYVLSQRQKDDPSRNEFRQFRDIRMNDPKGNPPASPLTMAGMAPGGGAPAPGGPAPFAAPPQGGPAPAPGAPAPFAPPGAPAPAPAPAPAFAPPPPQQPPAPFAPPQQPQAPAPAFAPPPAQAPAPAFAPPQQPQQQPQQQQQGGWAPPPAQAPAPAWGTR
jgi:hypothetical protein